MGKDTSFSLDEHLRAVRQALIDGEDSGLSTSFDFEKFIARKRADESHSR